MEKEESADSIQDVREKSKRLPYEAPELIAYNPSEIILGGANLKPGFDFIGGGTTTYRAS